MHRVDIPPWAIDRALERRGKLHVHENLEPTKTALVVIDLQNAFMVEEVAVAYVPTAVDIVANVNDLAAAVRRTGGRVYWIKQTVDDASSRAWSEWLAMMTPAVRQGLIANLAPGSRGHQLYPTLEVRPEDEIVQKYRFSAFVQGSSDLPERLCAAGCNTVLIAGTVTNVCCESSARDASTLGYRVIMVADACAAVRDQDHNATLHTIYRSFGDVRPAAEVIGMIESAGG